MEVSYRYRFCLTFKYFGIELFVFPTLSLDISSVSAIFLIEIDRSALKDAVNIIENLRNLHKLKIFQTVLRLRSQNLHIRTSRIASLKLNIKDTFHAMVLTYTYYYSSSLFSASYWVEYTSKVARVTRVSVYIFRDLDQR